jgi:hypothetical protein
LWRNLAQRLDPESDFAAPVTRDQIAGAETALKIAFPNELRELLIETDGIVVNYGLARVWPLARIVKDNLDFRSNADFPSLYMPFEPLLFIGDDGGGDQYAYRILAGKIENLDVFVWEHESDSRNWFARDLRDYLARSAGHEQYDPAKHGGTAAD